jgi:hypothetical protein
MLGKEAKGFICPLLKGHQCFSGNCMLWKKTAKGENLDEDKGYCLYRAALEKTATGILTYE